MKNFSMKWLLVAVICAPAAGGASAQTNSYTNMLNTIQMQNQSWYNQLNSYNQQFGGAARSAVQPGQAQPGMAAGQQQLAPRLPQYPITATDFYSLRVRVMPDHLANEQAALTPEQKTVMRVMYSQLLDDFEKLNQEQHGCCFDFRCAREPASRIRQAVVASGNRSARLELQQRAGGKSSVHHHAAERETGSVRKPDHHGRDDNGASDKGVQQNNLVMQVQATELGQAILKQWLNM